MDKILFVNACVRGESRTRRLAESIIKKLDSVLFRKTDDAEEEFVSGYDVTVNDAEADDDDND